MMEIATEDTIKRSVTSMRKLVTSRVLEMIVQKVLSDKRKTTTINKKRSQGWAT